MVYRRKTTDLVRCTECNTWQHDCRGMCPKCGAFITEEGRRRDAERKRKHAEREERIRKRRESYNIVEEEE